METKPKSYRLLLGLAIVLFLALSGGNKEQVSSAWDSLVTAQPGQYRVQRVDDGDTITINMNGRPERVRLIGVDTPELHHPQKPVQCFAAAAQKFTASLIGNQSVRLEADPLDDNRDLYGRLLRYVYLPDGILVNHKIIEEGHGFAYTHFPFVKKAEAISLELAAQREQRGLWSACKIEITEEGRQTQAL